MSSIPKMAVNFPPPVVPLDITGLPLFPAGAAAHALKAVEAIAEKKLNDSLEIDITTFDPAGVHVSRGPLQSG